ncbi:hypothetical protein Tco_0486849 [Tanacetum coccineum]
MGSTSVVGLVSSAATDTSFVDVLLSEFIQCATPLFSSRNEASVEYLRIKERELKMQEKMFALQQEEKWERDIIFHPVSTLITPDVPVVDPNGLTSHLTLIPSISPLSCRESKKATVKDYTKLVVTDGMVDYVLEKYGNKWKCEDKIAYVILKDLWLKYGKDDKGKGKEAEHDHLKVNKDDKGKGKLIDDKGKLVDDKGKGNEAEYDHLKVNKNDKGKRKVHDIQNRLGKLEIDLAREIKAKQVDDLDTLDLENIIKRPEEDFGRLLKVNKAKKAKEAELKAKEAKKVKEVELKAKKEVKAKEEMLAEVVQISSDEEDDDEDLTAPTSTRSRTPTAFTSTRFRAPTASTSTRSKAPIASTSNA